MKHQGFIIGLSFALSLLAAAVSGASAAPISYSFSGPITRIDPSVAFAFPGLAVGDLFSLSYSTESTEPDGNPGSIFGSFSSMQSVTVTLDTLVINLPNGGPIVVEDRAAGLGADRYNVNTALFLHSVLALDASLAMASAGGGAFISDAQPLALNLADFQTKILQINDAGGGAGVITASIDQIVVIDPNAMIPEPASAMMLGLACAAVAVRRRK